MSDLYEWFETTGGPHLLVPEELLAEWRGIEGWSATEDPNDHSDYGRTYRFKSWLGLIQCGEGSAVVLAGDVGAIAWINNGDVDGGYLVQWLGIDDEEEIYPALMSEDLREAFASEDAERLAFETGPSGVLRLIDSTDTGGDLFLPNHTIVLKAGRYRMNAAYLETETLMIVVRKISRL